LVIGLLVGAAERMPGQDGGAHAVDGPGWITGRDEALFDRFRRLLTSASTADMAAGWQLAADLGRPAVPLLWELLESEKANVRPRLVMLGAASLAGGLHEDARLFRWLAQPKPRLEERTLAAMLVALGPERPRPIDDFWPTFLAATKTPPRLLAVAVTMAAVRVPGAVAAAPAFDLDDAGAAAAASFAGLPLSPSVAAKFWQLRAPERHADLVWRGGLLGAARAGQSGDPMRQRALDVLAMPGEAMAAARDTAIWFAATAGELRSDGPRLDLQRLRTACGHPPTALAFAEQLGPDALLRDEQPERLAVAYAFAHPVARILAQRDRWAAQPSVRAHVAVALAFRLAGEASPAAVAVDDVPGLPEWQLVRAAAGVAVDREASCRDSRLTAAIRLVADGRLERRALRPLLEETLWRWGSHPRCGVFALERLLLRDVLLAGSNPGGHKYQPSVRPDQRYIPSGLDRDDGFFTVAVALFDFLQAPRAPMPAEHRLPN